MGLDDAWIKKNVDEITPESARFLLARHQMGKLKISQESADALSRRAFGHAGGAVPPGPDWAERAAGEHR